MVMLPHWAVYGWLSQTVALWVELVRSSMNNYLVLILMYLHTHTHTCIPGDTVSFYRLWISVSWTKLMLNSNPSWRRRLSRIWKKGYQPWRGMLLVHDNINTVSRVPAVEKHKTEVEWGLRVAIGFRRGIISYRWVYRPVCCTIFETQLPALLRTCDYSPYKCMVPVL